MPRLSKGLRGQWTTAMLQNAMTAIHNGMPVREASRAFGVPRRTLRNHLATGIETKSLGRKPTLSEDEENELSRRIIRFCNVGVPLTAKCIKTFVYDYVKKNNIGNQFSKERKQAGRNWLKGFLKRNPHISRRKAQKMNPARGQKLNRNIVGDHFEKLKALMEFIDVFDKPAQIFNMDEKGCRLTLHKNQTVYAQKGSKRVHQQGQEHGENVSIVACANALGMAIPPMIIFKGKRDNRHFGDNLPPSSIYRMSPKGSMTTELFVQFIDHLGAFKMPGKALLIFDGARSHLSPDIVDAADAHNIFLYCLASNTTHELQPLDKAVFRSFEHYWDTEVLKYWRQFPDRSVTKERFGSLFTPVWNKALTIGNITSGFRSTGIYPFDPTVIPDEAFAPSELTFREEEEMEFEQHSPGLPNTEAAPQSRPNLDRAVQQCKCNMCGKVLNTIADMMTHLEAHTSLQTAPSVSNNNSSIESTRPSTSGSTTNVPIELTRPSTSGSNTNTAMESIRPSTSGCTTNASTEPNSPSTPSRSSISTGSFHEFLKTPRISKPKTTRRKSLNYQSQHVTRSLFNETTNGNANMERRQAKSKGKGKKGKDGGKAVPTKGKENDSSWYCPVCEENRMIDMRACSICSVYVHEECVGLTKDDKEAFICFKCDTDDE